MKFKPLGRRLVKSWSTARRPLGHSVTHDTAKATDGRGCGDWRVWGRYGREDVVVFAKYSGIEIKLDDENYLILNSDDMRKT